MGRVGAGVGTPVGDFVGLDVGKRLGDLVGLNVVGDKDGADDGAEEGFPGSAVGGLVWHKPQVMGQRASLILSAPVTIRFLTSSHIPLVNFEQSIMLR